MSHALCAVSVCALREHERAPSLHRSLGCCAPCGESMRERRLFSAHSAAVRRAARARESAVSSLVTRQPGAHWVKTGSGAISPGIAPRQHT
jgi:hypothetical protein